jgi:hypothetical protein
MLILLAELTAAEKQPLGPDTVRAEGRDQQIAQTRRTERIELPQRQP